MNAGVVSLLDAVLGRFIYPRISGWSWSNLHSAFSLAENLGYCECCGCKKVRGCSTGALMFDLLVPGCCPGSSEFPLAADLGRVAVLELGRAEF